MAVIELEKAELAVSLAECKAYLRLDRDDEDAVLAALLRTAMALCEAFTGQWLMARDAEQRLLVNTDFQSLAVSPVRQIIGVSDGTVVLPAEAWSSEIGVDGIGMVKLMATAGLTTPVVQFNAGMGTDWNNIPEPLRHGIVRLAAHLFTHRDAESAGPPPAAVAALWRPWRQMGLG